MRVLDIVEGTTVDGPGLRTSIYVAGCRHQCEGCHNPQSWDFNAGREMSINELLGVVEKNNFNVTLSGGDPLYVADEAAELCRRIKEELNKNIWCYTGFVWENIVHKPEYRPLLETVDVLVDGPFVLARRDISLCFRGSGNQRIIDVRKSLAQDEVVVLKY
jgi:anaerobic ribonucleoside-triphosphate reductase activating protein